MNTEPITNEYTEIGDRLLRVRKTFSPKLGVKTLKDYADIFGFKSTQYINWEKGHRRIPFESAELLCDKFGVTLDFIYRGKEDALTQNALKALSSSPLDSL